MTTEQLLQQIIDQLQVISDFQQQAAWDYYSFLSGIILAVIFAISFKG